VADEKPKVAEIRQRILREAEDEAARILGEAQGAAHGTVERTRQEADAATTEAAAAARAQADRLRKARLAAAAAAARTRTLEARTAVLRHAYDAVREGLGALRERPEYPEQLKALIVEAALVLAPADDLEVLIDPRDEKTVTDDFLGSVEIVLTFSHNLAAHLRLGADRIQTAGGVVLRQRGGSRRCDNTFEERLRALRPELFRRTAAEVLGQ
jgi:vacuolar-type H+-ATPase subunit E/Vma4